jgi:hypothetical protein
MIMGTFGAYLAGSAHDHETWGPAQLAKMNPWAAKTVQSATLICVSDTKSGYVLLTPSIARHRFTYRGP